MMDVVLTERRQYYLEFFDWVHRNCHPDGCVRPLNYTVFEPRKAEQAFRHMSTGKHTGKLLIKLRDEEPDKQPLAMGAPVSPARDMMVTVKTYFDPNKSYIITGGLGGVGLELLPWMLYRGARKFVLTSRCGPKTNYQKFITGLFRQHFADYKYFASDMFISTANALTLEGTREMLREAERLGPIGGVFHLALVLNDSLAENMTPERFAETSDTKHRVFENLDQLTRGLGYKVDYFVVFSSVSAGKGNAGQCNYGYGNSRCERVCELRRRDGMHGLAVQYGPVGDVGVAADVDFSVGDITVQKQRIHSCLDVLDKLLAAKHPIVTSFLKKDLAKSFGTGTKKTRLVAELWRVMGVDPNTTPDRVTLGEIGLESMFGSEVQQEFEKTLNITVTINQIKSLTVGAFKEYESGRRDHIIKFLDERKRLRTHILRQKFTMPTEPWVWLNGHREGRAIYFMPTLVLNFSMVEEFAAKLDRPVIGLNWTREVSQLSTLDAVAKYYVEVLAGLERGNEGGYDVVGYLDTAHVCTKLLLKGMAGRAVIVDVMNADALYSEQSTDEFMIELMLKMISNEMPADIIGNIK
ncbi:unnamed protein product, partial [Medioppia subpectinata]